MSPDQKCNNCGRPGRHFVLPSFGEAGFYACEAIELEEVRRQRDELAVRLNAAEDEIKSLKLQIEELEYGDDL